MRKPTHPPRALTIAGSDSGGGAGIQADLKTFAAFRVYGMSAITALTAQSTVTVAAVHPAPAAFVAQQIDLVAADIGVDAAKTGMLFSAPIIRAVAAAVERNGIAKLVVDPVMIAKSGDALLRPDAQSAMKKLMIPRAFILTPNVPEAEAFAGMRIRTAHQLEEAAKVLHGLGARYVLMKGGHMKGDRADDILFDGASFQTFTGPRIPTKNTHGTGCTFSAAIAAGLAHGRSVEEAIMNAKAYLNRAITAALALGKGHGPLNHGV